MRALNHGRGGRGPSPRPRRHREADASNRPGVVMITRRRMLAASGGLAALATTGPAAAETPTLTGPTNRRNGIMEIKRSGSQPSRKAPAEYFAGTVRVDPLFQAP